MTIEPFVFSSGGFSINGLTISAEELADLRPDFAQPANLTYIFYGDRNGSIVHICSDGVNQRSGAVPWAAAEALLDDTSLASDLDDLRNPPLTLAQAKELKRDQINSVRDQAIAAGLMYVFPDGVTGTVDTRVQSDFDNLQALTTLAQELRAESEFNPVITFVDQEDQMHPLTPQEMIELGKAVTLAVAEIYAASWPLKQEVKAASTVDEVASIDINVGWP